MHSAIKCCAVPLSPPLTWAGIFQLRLLPCGTFQEASPLCLWAVLFVVFCFLKKIFEQLCLKKKKSTSFQIWVSRFPFLRISPLSKDLGFYLHSLGRSSPPCLLSILLSTARWILGLPEKHPMQKAHTNRWALLPVLLALWQRGLSQEHEVLRGCTVSNQV